MSLINDQQRKNSGVEPPVIKPLPQAPSSDLGISAASVTQDSFTPSIDPAQATASDASVQPWAQDSTGKFRPESEFPSVDVPPAFGELSSKPPEQINISNATDVTAPIQLPPLPKLPSLFTDTSEQGIGFNFNQQVVSTQLPTLFNTTPDIGSAARQGNQIFSRNATEAAQKQANQLAQANQQALQAQEQRGALANVPRVDKPWHATVTGFVKDILFGTEEAQKQADRGTFAPLNPGIWNNTYGRQGAGLGGGIKYLLNVGQNLLVGGIAEVNKAAASGFQALGADKKTAEGLARNGILTFLPDKVGALEFSRIKPSNILGFNFDSARKQGNLVQRALTGDDVADINDPKSATETNTGRVFYSPRREQGQAFYQDPLGTALQIGSYVLDPSDVAVDVFKQGIGKLFGRTGQQAVSGRTLEQLAKETPQQYTNVPRLPSGNTNKQVEELAKRAEAAREAMRARAEARNRVLITPAPVNPRTPDGAIIATGTELKPPKALPPIRNTPPERALTQLDNTPGALVSPQQTGIAAKSPGFENFREPWVEGQNALVTPPPKPITANEGILSQAPGYENFREQFFKPREIDTQTPGISQQLPGFENFREPAGGALVKVEPQVPVVDAEIVFEPPKLDYPSAATPTKVITIDVDGTTVQRLLPPAINPGLVPPKNINDYLPKSSPAYTALDIGIGTPSVEPVLDIGELTIRTYPEMIEAITNTEPKLLTGYTGSTWDELKQHFTSGNWQRDLLGQLPESTKAPELDFAQFNVVGKELPPVYEQAITGSVDVELVNTIDALQASSNNFVYIPDLLKLLPEQDSSAFLNRLHELERQDKIWVSLEADFDYLNGHIEVPGNEKISELFSDFLSTNGVPVTKAPATIVNETPVTPSFSNLEEVSQPPSATTTVDTPPQLPTNPSPLDTATNVSPVADAVASPSLLPDSIPGMSDDDVYQVGEQALALAFDVDLSNQAQVGSRITGAIDAVRSGSKSKLIDELNSESAIDHSALILTDLNNKLGVQVEPLVKYSAKLLIDKLVEVAPDELFKIRVKDRLLRVAPERITNPADRYILDILGFEWNGSKWVKGGEKTTVAKPPTTAAPTPASETSANITPELIQKLTGKQIPANVDSAYFIERFNEGINVAGYSPKIAYEEALVDAQELARAVGKAPPKATTTTTTAATLPTDVQKLVDNNPNAAAILEQLKAAGIVNDDVYKLAKEELAKKAPTKAAEALPAPKLPEPPPAKPRTPRKKPTPSLDDLSHAAQELAAQKLTIEAPLKQLDELFDETVDFGRRATQRESLKPTTADEVLSILENGGKPLLHDAVNQAPAGAILRNTGDYTELSRLSANIGVPVQELIQEVVDISNRAITTPALVNRKLTPATVKQLPAKPLYHGSALSDWQPNYNLSVSGSRGELGSGLYLTTNKKAATEYAKARMGENVNPATLDYDIDKPGVYEVAHSLQTPLDARAKIPSNSNFFTMLLNTLSPEIAAQVKRSFSKKKDQTYSGFLNAVESSIVKAGVEPTEDLLQDIQQGFSKQLLAFGYDSVYDAKSGFVAVLDNSSLSVKSKLPVKPPTATQAALARYNADAYASKFFPERPTTDANLRDSAYKVLEQLKQNVDDKLAEVQQELIKRVGAEETEGILAKVNTPEPAPRPTSVSELMSEIEKTTSDLCGL